MQYLRYLVALFLITALAVEAQEPARERGPELLAPFKTELQQALRDGLAQGPAEAIAVCRLKAPEISDSLSHDGVRMGRTSHRLRNPDNASPDWVSPVLEDYIKSEADREPRVVPLSNDRVGYVEPILLQPLCLTCHGETLAPDIASRINELYPEDRATGFDVGDLRGVFWVEFPATDD